MPFQLVFFWGGQLLVEDMSEDSFKTHLKRLGTLLAATWGPKRLQDSIEMWDLFLAAVGWGL